MTYSTLAALGVVLALVLDRYVARTRLTSTREWWAAYAIICFFQLLTNGWLTGRRIVRYDPDTILGNAEVVFIGAGRLVFAPVEDLAFGFALVLTACVVWDWWGKREHSTDHSPRSRSGAARGHETGDEVGT